MGPTAEALSTAYTDEKGESPEIKIVDDVYVPGRDNLILLDTYGVLD
jgi:hypothetical protein